MKRGVVYLNNRDARMICNAHTPLEEPSENVAAQFVGLVFLRIYTCSQHVRVDRASLDVESKTYTNVTLAVKCIQCATEPPAPRLCPLRQVISKSSLGYINLV